jgi:signal transduction histidine kinase
VLSDAQGDTIYQWGPYAGAEGEPPEVRRTLAAPLDAWSLAVYTPRERRGLADRGVAFNVLSGLVAIGLCLLGLAVYLYREGSRELREASQRASFVNQVSHELKTPLTNIRLYAELLESRLRDADVRTRDHARVVVSECQRLSRLVNNVLTFARSQKRRLSLRAQPGVVDEVVSAVIEGFRPALESKGIRIAVSGSCPARVLMDRDAIEQVLGNLFGNVEKYAADGRLLEVSTSALDDRTVITVADRGPGIPARYREKVFAPFFRLSDRLADGVTGTGIGLSIARTLARLHGGDLTLEPAECGARFRVELRTPPADGRHPEGTGDENPGG